MVGEHRQILAPHRAIVIPALVLDVALEAARHAADRVGRMFADLRGKLERVEHHGRITHAVREFEHRINQARGHRCLRLQHLPATHRVLRQPDRFRRAALIRHQHAAFAGRGFGKPRDDTRRHAAIAKRLQEFSDRPFHGRPVRQVIVRLRR